MILKGKLPNAQTNRLFFAISDITACFVVMVTKVNMQLYQEHMDVLREQEQHTYRHCGY